MMTLDCTIIQHVGEMSIQNGLVLLIFMSQETRFSSKHLDFVNASKLQKVQLKASRLCQCL